MLALIIEVGTRLALRACTRDVLRTRDVIRTKERQP
jgi:hypothetical protein